MHYYLNNMHQLIYLSLNKNTRIQFPSKLPNYLVRANFFSLLKQKKLILIGKKP